MIKKKLKFFLIILLLTSCSFDKKTGIWSGSEKEKRRISELEKEQKSIIEVKKIYSTENFYDKQINLTKNIIISGCLFFPFEFTCFNNLSWYSRGRATVAREALANQHIAYLFNKPLDIWFTDWILHGKNYQIYTNFFISFI